MSARQIEATAWNLCASQEEYGKCFNYVNTNGKREGFVMNKVYVTEEERISGRKVMEAFSEMYEEQDIIVVEAGNYGFVRLQWLREREFEIARVYSDSGELFDDLWEIWFDYHVLMPVLGTSAVELDYEEIFRLLPEDKQEELVRKREYFQSLCGDTIKQANTQ